MINITAAEYARQEKLSDLRHKLVLDNLVDDIYKKLLEVRLEIQDIFEFADKEELEENDEHILTKLLENINDYMADIIEYEEKDKK